MPNYSVVEGEGIAGPETAVSAVTTALYSCIGIVMRNAKDRFAGLYHYPANAIKNDITQRTILQMLNDLVPTEVFLTAPPPTPIEFYGGATGGDRDAVEGFLVKHSLHARPKWMPDKTFSSYQMIDGKFSVNAPTSLLLPRVRSEKLLTATKQPNHHGRKIDANTTFYGGEDLGELANASKHDQGLKRIRLLPPGKGSSSSKCILS